MHKAQLAELILSLFTSRKRAASTVGDLIENAPGRGTWWFWSDVSRTALSLFWRSFSAAPGFIAGIGARALLLNLSLFIALLIGIGIFAVLFSPLLAVRFTPGTAALRSPWLIRMAGAIGAFAVEFQTGRWIARRARDREMAACVAFLIIHSIVMPIVGEILFGGRWLGDLTKGPDLPASNTTTASIVLTTLLSVIALLTGAIAVRYRFIKEAAR